MQPGLHQVPFSPVPRLFMNVPLQQAQLGHTLPRPGGGSSSLLQPGGRPRYAEGPPRVYRPAPLTLEQMHELGLTEQQAALLSPERLLHLRVQHRVPLPPELQVRPSGHPKQAKRDQKKQGAKQGAKLINDNKNSGKRKATSSTSDSQERPGSSNYALKKGPPPTDLKYGMKITQEALTERQRLGREQRDRLNRLLKVSPESLPWANVRGVSKAAKKGVQKVRGEKGDAEGR